MSRDRFDVLERFAPLFEAPEPSFREFLHRRERKERNRRMATVVVALAVAAAGIGGLVRTFSSDTIPAGDPRSPFLGTWLSTDMDGSNQTMTIGAEDVAVEIVVHDDSATVCSGAPSTMTGTGRLEGAGELLIPAPILTCDDGTEPQALSGPPVEEQLRNMTFVHDPATDALTDNLGVVWRREGSEPAPQTTMSGGMWPQSSLDEVREAQERADAGDPNYAWQVEPRLFIDDTWIEDGVEIELVDRFLREVLGWEMYTLNPFEGMARGGVYDVFYDQRYLRCAPGRTNPLYPGESCKPTIDDLSYESVSLDLAQLARQGRDGIWVVARWNLTAPFAQADPAVVEAEATEGLEEFLAARIAGAGAEGSVQVDGNVDVPLLYATTSGARYERYEIELVDGPEWPYGGMTFSVRLFADGDATVVEQTVRWDPRSGMSLDARATTENGQPVNLSYTSSDGEVTVSAPSTWQGYWPDEVEPDVWFGVLWRGPGFFPGTESIGFNDPVAYDSWCAENGGSPLLSAPADAAAIAQQVVADPNFETTAPVPARVGGLEAVSIDVSLAPGGKNCGVYMIEISRWIHSLEPGLRLRLYLVDLPKGMSVKTLAITVVAPEDDFEEVIEETAPIIDSIEFHTG